MPFWHGSRSARFRGAAGTVSAQYPISSHFCSEYLKIALAPYVHPERFAIRSNAYSGGRPCPALSALATRQLGSGIHSAPTSFRRAGRRKSTPAKPFRPESWNDNPCRSKPSRVRPRMSWDYNHDRFNCQPTFFRLTSITVRAVFSIAPLTAYLPSRCHHKMLCTLPIDGNAYFVRLSELVSMTSTEPGIFSNATHPRRPVFGIRQIVVRCPLGATFFIIFADRDPQLPIDSDSLLNNTRARFFSTGQDDAGGISRPRITSH